MLLILLLYYSIMKQEIEDIATALEFSPGKKFRGKDKALSEFQNFLELNPLTDRLITFLLRKSSPSAIRKAEDYDQIHTSADQQASYIEYCCRDGLGKLIGALHGALDYSQPSDWVIEIQQLHTLTSDLVRNSRLIFNGLSTEDFPFYSHAIDEIEDRALPALEKSMSDNRIPITRDYPESGSEFFYRFDRNDWKSLSRSLTAKPLKL